MYYVTNPDSVVAHIQILIDAEIERVVPVREKVAPTSQKPEPLPIVSSTKKDRSSIHAVDTREQVRDILE
jgi:hypothetical protein